MIFNDLKGLVFFEQSLIDGYRTPNEGEVSYHAGERIGLALQLTKFRVSTMHEFFRFIKENESILNLPEFQLILKKTAKAAIDDWATIVSVALEKKTENNFSSSLIQIRNNVTFHFYQSRQTLWQHYQDFFFSREKVQHNEKAYFSLGDSMKSTRFFYVDAAVQEYLMSQRILIDPQNSGDNFNELVSDVVTKMNQALALLIDSYLKHCRAKST